MELNKIMLLTTYKALVFMKPEPPLRAVLVKIELVCTLIPSILLLTVQLISQLQADSLSSQC
jgi:hypothetical protein